MEQRKLRAAIVGASTLLGKEVAEQLADDSLRTWDLTLLDEEDSAGQMTAAGEEAMLIQPLGPGSFTAMDVVFFASDAASAKAHSKEAQQSGAAVVDLSGALEAAVGVQVVSPWLEGAAGPDLTTVAVVSAHPAALMLALISTRLQAKFGAVKLVATVLQPVSQHGKAGLDELHAQTVAVLSFQSVPHELYDAQVSFNTQASLGADAKVGLDEEAARVRRHFAALAGKAALAMQLVQAPVFNGYTASVHVELAQASTIKDVQQALNGGAVRVTVEDLDAPSNLNATEQSEVLVAVRGDDGSADGQGYWLWVAADNLRLAAGNAVACAIELAKLRPAGKVQ